LNLSAARVEAFVWILIYGGLLVASLGFALARNWVAWGWALVVAGAAAAVAGAVLVWVRSRMSEPSES
jgi:hypothetical protein